MSFSGQRTESYSTELYREYAAQQRRRAIIGWGGKEKKKKKTAVGWEAKNEYQRNCEMEPYFTVQQRTFVGDVPMTSLGLAGATSIRATSLCRTCRAAIFDPDNIVVITVIS